MSGVRTRYRRLQPRVGEIYAWVFNNWNNGVMTCTTIGMVFEIDEESQTAKVMTTDGSMRTPNFEAFFPDCEQIPNQRDEFGWVRVNT